MGTSTSSKGPGSNSPLVPPWADSTPDQPLPPPPDEQRFNAFRRNMGKFVKSGETSVLRHSLGKYASQATGGSSVGPRRFGAMSKAGGNLFGVINELRIGGTGEEVAGVVLSDLSGKDINYAIQEIVTSLLPENGDSDKIRVSMNVALSESLEGMEDFDPSMITDDILINMMVFYLRECVFQQVIMDSDKAFQKGSIQECQSAEGELHDLVASIVDESMRPIFSEGTTSLTPQQVNDIQLQAVGEVWGIWEGYYE